MTSQHTAMVKLCLQVLKHWVVDKLDTFSEVDIHDFDDDLRDQAVAIQDRVFTWFSAH